MGEKLINDIIQKAELATPANDPPPGFVFEYYKPDGNLYRKNSAGVEIQIGASGDNDKVAVSANDTTSNFLLLKVSAGNGIDLNELNDGGDEDLEIAIGDDALKTISTTLTVDATVEAATNLFTVPAGKTCVITRIDFIPSTITGFSGIPDAGVGIAVGEDDIMTDQNLTDLDAVGKVFSFVTEGNFVVGNAGETIKVGIDSASSSTTYEMTVKLSGYIF